MAYIVQADLETLIPPDFIVQALDDDGDGLADVGLWEQIANQASGDVDAYLGQRYPVPVSAPVPALVFSAAKIFACELLHQRRGMYGDKNPFTKRANEWRTRLGKIAAGDESLDPASAPARPPISIISEPARTVPRGSLNG